jgi:periplasmic divalent cation tolerance protein
MRVVLCTCPPAEAERIAKGLVEKGAACVNIVAGVRSIYRWEGRIHDDAESLLVVKAAVEVVPSLQEALAGLHPYALPEWVVLGTDEVLTSAAYRAWVRG